MSRSHYAKLLRVAGIFPVVFALSAQLSWAGLGGITDPIAGDYSASSGEAFTVYADYDGGGCNDGTTITANAGSCVTTIKHDSYPAGCGRHGGTSTITMSVNPTTVCEVRIRGDASTSGEEVVYRYVKIDQTAVIGNAQPASQSVGVVSRQLTYTVTSKGGTNSTKAAAGNTGTWSALGTNGCSVDATGLITYGNGPGTCNVTLNIQGNSDLTATSVASNTTLNQTPQTMTITTAAPAGPLLYNAFFNVAATVTSGYEVLITASGGCVVSKTGSGMAKVTINSTLSSCVLYYNQSGLNATGYAVYSTVPEQSSTTTVSAAKVNQSISSFTTIPTQTYSPTQLIPLSAVATSGYLVTYTSTTPTVCSLTGVGNDVITMLNVGTCTIKADQSGNANYNAAPQVSQSFTINKASQVISVNSAAPASAQQGASFNVAATSSSGLAVSIVASGCSYAAGTVNGLVIGTPCNLTYSQAGDVKYNAAVAVMSSTTVTQLVQAITITQVPAASVALNSTFNVAAMADSSLAVAITVTGGCSITSGGSGSAAIKLTSGTIPCTVKYNQAGNATYAAAAEAISSVTAIRTPQTITVTTAAPLSALVNASFPVAASSSSALAVTITVAGGCSITAGGTNSATIKMTSATTSCTVSYNQAGNDSYSPSATATNVVKDGTAPTISLVTPVPNPTNTNPELTINTNETGSIIFSGACSSDNAVASLGNNTITLKSMAAGTYSNCTVKVVDAFGNDSNVIALASFNVLNKIIMYVKETALGAADCSSWVNACADIQVAINKPGVTEVWVAKGVYRPASTIILKAGVGVYGGFAGNEKNYVPSSIAIIVDQENGIWSTSVDYGVSKKIENLTIISGDKDGDDVIDSRGLVLASADIVGSNLAQLMSANNLSLLASKKVKLSGIILNAASGAASGAALVVNNSVVEADRTQFVFNKGATGGGVSVLGGGQFLAIDSVFLKNTATGVGGAVASTGSTANQVLIQRSIVQENKANTSGGGVHHATGMLWVMNTTFFGNSLTSTTGKGGALDLVDITYPSMADIRYVTMLNNSAGPDAATANGRGGAININTAATGVATLANSMIMSNNAAATGGRNIADMARITNGGYNVVGYNGISGITTGVSTNYDFVGSSSVTAPTTLLKDIMDTDALGEPLLTNNGGYTASVKLLENSFARDRIPNIHADCEKLSSVGVDQRGYPRPQVEGNFCDVGAIEWDKNDPCTDPNRQKGFFVMFYPDAVCLANGGFNVSAGTVNPLLLLMMSIMGLAMSLIRRKSLSR